MDFSLCERIIENISRVIVRKQPAIELLLVALLADGHALISKIFGDILDYHTSPVDAAKIANMAGVKQLVLYHIVPMLPVDAMIPLFVEGASDEFSGKITVSEDGLIVRLPVGGEAIVHEDGL